MLTGDIQTDNDARRLSRYGYPVRQITTAGACHLDARMVENHLDDGCDAAALDLLFIENVGNLVCPTSYDLGEDAKIVVLSVTEGEDKPLKYPGIFRKAELMILNKIDLLPVRSLRSAAGAGKRAADPSGNRNYRNILHHRRWAWTTGSPGSPARAQTKKAALRAEEVGHVVA